MISCDQVSLPPYPTHLFLFNANFVVLAPFHHCQLAPILSLLLSLPVLLQLSTHRFDLQVVVVVVVQSLHRSDPLLGFLQIHLPLGSELWWTETEDYDPSVLIPIPLE